MIYLDNNTGTQQVYIPRETMNIKTVPVGTGGANVDLSDYYTKEEIEQNYYAKSIMDEYINNTKDNTTYIDHLEESKQDVLYSGINIKTIKGESILGGGDVDFSEYYTKEEIDALFGEQVEVRCIKGLSDDMTDEIKAYNTETYNKLVDYADVVVFIGQWLMLNCHIRPQNNEVECFFKADTSRGFVGLGSIILKSDGTIEYGDMFELQRTVTFDTPASVTDFFTNSERYLSYDIMPNVKFDGHPYGDGCITQATMVNVDDWIVEFSINGERYIRHYDSESGEVAYDEVFSSSSGGGGYDSNPTFDSITVNGGAYFNSEIVMAGGGQSDSSDIAEGIACAFKAGKTQSIDQWVRNIHTGTDGQGLRVCSYDENGGTQYMAVDTEGNIYEGDTKLSDKYALKGTTGNGEPIDLSHYLTKSEFDEVVGNINNILTSI